MKNEEALEHVLELASDYHKGFYRKSSGIPYVCHPIEVMQKLVDWKINDFSILAAALLHDILEQEMEGDDSPEEMLEVEMSILYVINGNDESASIMTPVLSYVKELTHNLKEQKKEDYMRSFDKKSVQSLVIKIADRLCNVKDFRIYSPEYAKKYFEKASDLFKQFFLRKDEIIAAFSKEIWWAIEAGCYRMADSMKSLIFTAAKHNKL